MHRPLSSAALIAGILPLAAGSAKAHIVITTMTQPAVREGAGVPPMVPHGCGPEPTTEVSPLPHGFREDQFGIR